MKKSYRPNLFVALIHYPVTNKNGDTIASAITNLDLHDIARLARTYDLPAFYVVTPLKDQQELAGRIISHWTSGPGGVQNPKRRQAMELIWIKDSLEEVISHIQEKTNRFPKTVVTSARKIEGRISFGTFRDLLQDGNPYLLILGTGWGLSESLIGDADYVLEPVGGVANYNHLSVRCAAAIVVDRLMGDYNNENVSSSSRPV